MPRTIATKADGPTANTEASFERLIIVEQKQKQMSKSIDSLTNSLKENTEITTSIKTALDELTGGKQALMWFTGLIVSILLVVASWLGFHHK